MYTFAVVTCLLGVAAAAPHGSLGYAAIDSVSIPNYGFSYAVNDPVTGDNKAQQEVREGDVVKGSYSLAEPDGTIRVVNYRADPVSGFNAVVKNIGTAVHPQRIPVISKPIIAAPIAAPVSYSLSNLVSVGGGYENLGGLGGLGLGGLGQSGLGGLGLGNLGGLGYNGLSLGGLGWGQGGAGWGQGGLGWGHGGAGWGQSGAGWGQGGAGWGLGGSGWGQGWSHK